MAPRILKRLGITHEATHITTHGLNGGVMEHAKERWKTRIAVQYLDYFAAVVESDLLVMSMPVYDVVLDSPWFHKSNADIDWAYR
jgi:predicted lipid carrier protein YhbT